MNANQMTSLTSIAKELVEALVDTRTRELELLSDLTDDQLWGPKTRIIEPPLWEMGHVGWFQERWILRNLDHLTPLNSKADSLYDSFNITNAQRWDIPLLSRAETLGYITAVLERCIHRLEDHEPTEREIYFYRLVINHEDMHSETLHHIRQTLGYKTPVFPGLQPAAIDLDFELHDVTIPSGTFQLGATQDMPFVLDNEKWAHLVEIALFRIAATPVTTQEYQAFVEAGGYLQ